MTMTGILFYPNYIIVLKRICLNLLIDNENIYIFQTGDKIAIMASGKVQCYGSSLFLKNRYGVGYHMVMVKTSSCDVSKVKEVIFRHIPTAELESDIGKIFYLLLKIISYLYYIY